MFTEGQNGRLLDVEIIVEAVKTLREEGKSPGPDDLLALLLR